uniref:WEB family protein At1g65010, chloroplastic n=1 Tax=Cicer arietinum TaxID=3827 RepID=A0A1S3DUW6_CICAR|nr:putative WEB family protein At1g65010, chloroplastic [Cicer arietinum]
MISHKEWLMDIDTSRRIKIRYVDDRTLEAEGADNIVIKRRNGKTTENDVLHAESKEEGLELQNQLNTTQEDLKKTKEQILQAEKEKVKAIDELKEAQKVVEEANEKLREALVAQKLANEESEIEKFQKKHFKEIGIEVVSSDDDSTQCSSAFVDTVAVDLELHKSYLSSHSSIEEIKQATSSSLEFQSSELNTDEDSSEDESMTNDLIKSSKAERERILVNEVLEPTTRFIKENDVSNVEFKSTIHDYVDRDDEKVPELVHIVEVDGLGSDEVVSNDKVLKKYKKDKKDNVDKVKEAKRKKLELRESVKNQERSWFKC